MSRSLRGLIVLGLASFLFGCYTTPRPDLLRPGTQDYQRSNASRHDPYGDRDAGPEAVGSRPREFMYPLAEPRRSQPFEQQPRPSPFP